MQDDGGRPDYRGDFETHLTVAAEADTFATLQAVSADLGARFLHIELPRGKMLSQPMLSWRDRGDLTHLLAAAARRSAQLQIAGFAVMRSKIEAAPDNADIPRHGGAVLPGQYFESHLKIALAAGADVAALAALAQRHAAHLSRNAFSRAADGQEHRFITQRLSGTGLERARERLAQLTAALTALGHAPLRSELEFVIHDSNLALDAGWIEGGG